MRDFFLYLISAVIIAAYIGMSTHLTFYEGASVALLIYNLFSFLGNLGRKVVVLDIAIILASFTWLVMPVIFYHNYTKDDYTARIFYKYMPITSEDYFSFVFPGTLAMTIGYKLRLAKLQINANSEEYKERVRRFFRGKDKIGYILIGVSLVSGVLRYILPASIGRVIYLLEHMSFVGVFYIFFSENKRKGLILGGVIGLTLLASIKTGLFGELVYSMALFYILIALFLKQMHFFTKLTICLLAFFFVFLMQNVKTVYRAYSWKQGASASYFLEVMGDRLMAPSMMFEKKKLFATAVRMNQGWLVGVTMDRVPRRFPYANGETIGVSIAAAFIPRVFWPDKPESGGKYNLKRFWGYNLVGYSMNIGPIGEAYANFGRTGGIIFMFFYGLFFNALLTYLLKWSEKKPSILCWIPFLYFYAVVVETDVLTTFSSLVTGVFFMIAFIYVFRKVTGLNL
ncbi:hypothetical protein Q4E93_26300 [Flavitalea sp. BT771]|uniref:hypothetical protein n=1 Tax=Flavitalea sp. BT771 TaxID=3063329 RepID=UPI0026E4177E|nr:hypothetical protein [Flavitalea sp. BT771]MDO6434148.1 hypothetical protein [Flavitalea sp. BT771]MDV6223048.1 hypothetical protein [Flavitalea sp. BT771]